MKRLLDPSQERARLKRSFPNSSHISLIGDQLKLVTPYNGLFVWSEGDRQRDSLICHISVSEKESREWVREEHSQPTLWNQTFDLCYPPTEAE